MTSLYLNCDGEGILDTSRSEINYRYWLSDEATRIMIYIHGMGSHSGRAHYLADFFKKNNTSIYAMDQQGHGKRKGKTFVFRKDPERVLIKTSSLPR